MRSRLIGATRVLTGLVVSAAALAQDEPIPLDYRFLHVDVQEVQASRNRALQGARVTVRPVDPTAEDPFVRFPAETTIRGNGPARLGKLPPTASLGTPYEVTVVPAECPDRVQTRTVRMSGRSDTRVQFRFDPCPRPVAFGAASDLLVTGTAYPRRGQVGDCNNLTVKLLNRQGVAEESFQVRMTVSGPGSRPRSYTETVHGLGRHRTTQVTFEGIAFAAPGDHTVEVEVDPAEAVPDVDRRNNDRTRRLRVAGICPAAP